MNKRILFLGLALSFILGVASVNLWRFCVRGESHTYRGNAVEQIPQLVGEQNRGLADLLVANYHEYRDNSVRWSGVYFGCLFGAAALSALAALLLKLSILDSYPRLQKDIPAIFATIAALLITVSTSGDFSRKWQANRLAASDMENLAYDLLPQAARAEDYSLLIQQLQSINTARNLLIVGTDKPLLKPPPADKAEDKRIPSPSDAEGSKDTDGLPVPRTRETPQPRN